MQYFNCSILLNELSSVTPTKVGGGGGGGGETVECPRMEVNGHLSESLISIFFKCGGCAPTVEWPFFNFQDIIHGVC